MSNELQYQDQPADPKSYLPEPKKAAGKDQAHPFYMKASYTPKEGEKLYEATGESGQIAVQSHPRVMTHAVSVADPGYPGARAKFIRIGVVRHFFPSKAKAERYAEKNRELRPDCRFVVVPVREYTGGP